MSDILPESGLIYTYSVTKFLTCRFFQKNPCWQEWYILYFWDVQIGVRNGVEIDFWLRHYFVWYIAWKWSQYIFSNKISYLQNFSEKPCVGEWYILYFWNDQIVVHNGVETDFWLRHYFVRYIAWKWSHLYIFSDKISYLQNFSEKPCVGEWYILYFWNDQIVVHNGVETDFWLRHYFVWYIAWKWSHLYIFSDKISYLQIFSEKPLLARVIYFIFLRCPNWCPQWCRDRFLIKALFCLIYCLKMVSIHI